jgi:hypothetical protein
MGHWVSEGIAIGMDVGEMEGQKAEKASQSTIRQHRLLVIPPIRGRRRNSDGGQKAAGRSFSFLALLNPGLAKAARLISQESVGQTKGRKASFCWSAVLHFFFPRPSAPKVQLFSFPPLVFCSPRLPLFLARLGSTETQPWGGEGTDGEEVEKGGMNAKLGGQTWPAVKLGHEEGNWGGWRAKRR